RLAANKGDIQKLKELNSIGWAIVALIFTGIIPGIMLLIAHSAIEQLNSGGVISDSSIDKVLKLKSMMDAGIITKEEFEAQKNRIMYGSSSDPVEQKLKDLKALLDSGAISQSEYEEQKSKILRGI
ncbi:MAG: SHOCT domain-containing protein, partial [Minisyncoccia bacterium]